MGGTAEFSIAASVARNTSTAIESRCLRAAKRSARRRSIIDSSVTVER